MVSKHSTWHRCKFNMGCCNYIVRMVLIHNAAISCPGAKIRKHLKEEISRSKLSICLFACIGVIPRFY